MAKVPNIIRKYARNYVQIRFRRQGKVWEESFSISKYDKSWEKAEQAAIDRREILAKEVPDPVSPRKGRMTKVNSSGVVGVSFQHCNATSSNGTIHRYSCFEASWLVESRKVVIRWAVKKHGLKDAFVLAVLSRRMESKDREAVLAEFEKIRNTKQFNEIADLCSVCR
jgi:hypothetical protein